MGVGDFYVVDFDKDKVIEFVGVNGGIEVGNYFVYGGGFVCIWSIRDVDVGFRVVGDGSFEV